MASSSCPFSEPSGLKEERTGLPPPRWPINLSNTDLNIVKLELLTAVALSLLWHCKTSQKPQMRLTQIPHTSQNTLQINEKLNLLFYPIDQRVESRCDQSPR